MAHRKAGGTARKLRDSNPQYLGVKLADGQKATPGAIIVRQRGTKFIAGDNVSQANDDSLFATTTGIVKFQSKRKKRFDGKVVQRKIVHVV